MKRGEQTEQMRTKKLNKNKRIFLAVEQRRYQFKHTCTKKVNILNHTHKDTHANIVIHAHITIKLCLLKNGTELLLTKERIINARYT